jgi:hypothetical protein
MFQLQRLFAVDRSGVRPARRSAGGESLLRPQERLAPDLIDFRGSRLCVEFCDAQVRLDTFDCS